MSTYAATTSVSTEQSRAEIERTLQRWGAPQIDVAYTTGQMPSMLPALGSGQ